LTLAVVCSVFLYHFRDSCSSLVYVCHDDIHVCTYTYAYNTRAHVSASLSGSSDRLKADQFLAFAHAHTVLPQPAGLHSRQTHIVLFDVPEIIAEAPLHVESHIFLSCSVPGQGCYGCMCVSVPPVCKKILYPVGVSVHVHL